MTYKRMFLSIIIICFISIVLQDMKQPVEVRAFSDQVIQQGSVGDDVIELQARLQYIGFYHGEIDGVFGWGTYWALRNFQEEFGLKQVDGLGGQKTKEMLERATDYDEEFVKEQIRKGNRFTHYGGMDKAKQSAPQNNQGGEQTPGTTNEGTNEQPADPGTQGNQGNEGEGDQAPEQPQGGDTGAEETPEQDQGTDDAEDTTEEAAPEELDDADEGQTTSAVNVPQGYSQNDIQLMANAVYGEARGEPYEGQVAVAAVILNRIESPTFPNTVSGVIFEPRAFTAVADGQIWLTPNEKAREAVLDAINGWDPSGNATYYFNPDTATSSWIWGRPQIKRIGKHIFCN